MPLLGFVSAQAYSTSLCCAGEFTLLRDALQLAIPDYISASAEQGKHCHRAMDPYGAEYANGLATGDEAVNSVAGQDSGGADYRRCQNQERLRQPAQAPSRSAFRHVAVMRNLPVPFSIKLSKANCAPGGIRSSRECIENEVRLLAHVFPIPYLPPRRCRRRDQSLQNLGETSQCCPYRSSRAARCRA